jgi:urease accessory protein
MLRIERRAEPESEPSDTLRLAYDDRKKSRMRVWSEQRREVGIFLPWGSVLRDRDLLAANSGEVLLVRAAAEPLSEVRTRDWHLLTRAAYHLGNRHVPLQIQPGILRYQRDHVLDEMLEQMGLPVLAVEAPFEPEAGAYAGGHSHAHADADERDAAHTHAAESRQGGHEVSHTHAGEAPHSHGAVGGHTHGGEAWHSHGREIHKHEASDAHGHEAASLRDHTHEHGCAAEAGRAGGQDSASPDAHSDRPHRHEPNGRRA